MTTDAATPAGFWERVEQVAERVVAKYARSGASRNTSIGEGGTFTLRGGIFRLIYGAINLFYVGPISPSLPDGTPQQGITWRRADGSLALQTRDAFPGSDGTLNQALTWYDRAGNAVFADDTDSGQGIARPSLGGVFAATQFADFRFSTTSATFVTLSDQWVTKQQPRLLVGVRASMDTAATTGELKVLVDGVQLDSTAPIAFAVGVNTFLAYVAGSHMAEMHVEIQGRVTSGSGALRVEPLYWKGRQS